MNDPQENYARYRSILLKLSAQQGVSLAALSKMIGRNASYLQQYIRKGSPRKLEEDDRRKLADFFGVSESELGGPEEKSYTKPVIAAQWVDVPRIPLDASAGPGAVAADEAPFDAFRFSSRWLREQGLEGARLSAITVSGDSMEPLLRSGDEILVDTRPQSLRDGIYVVRLGDVLHVKRVQAGQPGRLTLISQNLAYPPMEVPLEEVDIVGRVVWKGGRV